MSDAIAVLNAGSPSLKFALFAERGNALELNVRGQIEALHTAPRFVAKAFQYRRARDEHQCRRRRGRLLESS